MDIVLPVAFIKSFMAIVSNVPELADTLPA